MNERIRQLFAWTFAYGAAYMIGEGIGMAMTLDNTKPPVFICVGIVLMFHAISIGDGIK